MPADVERESPVDVSRHRSNSLARSSASERRRSYRSALAGPFIARTVHDSLPPTRAVVHFHIDGSTDGRSHFWLVLDGHDVDLCTTDPGYDVDLEVRGHARDLLRYWLGDADLADLIARQELVLTGPTGLLRDFPTWFARSQFADVDRDIGPA